MTNEQAIFPIIKKFNEDIDNGRFVIAREQKIVEKINAVLELDPTKQVLDFAVKKTNEEYCRKETIWYESQSRSIKGYVDDIAVWKEVADKKGNINSNYGWCIFSEENGQQYEYCLETLKNDIGSRQAIMIYNRPSMHEDWNANGMTDFICTMFHHFFIRNNELISIYSIRSNDFVFGFFNDFYWACYIHQKFYQALKADKKFITLKIGKLYWNANSLHVYERHFKMIKNMYEHRRYYI